MTADARRAPSMLTRYEVARIVGLRALQIDEGSLPFVEAGDGECSLRIATRELADRKLDVLVSRQGELHAVKEMEYPKDVQVLMTIMGGRGGEGDTSHT